MLLALLALGLLNGASLPESVLDVEEEVDVEGRNEVPRAGSREAGHAAARGTADIAGLVVRLDGELETLLAEDMEAGEDPGVGVAGEADGAGELVFHFLKCCDNYLLRHLFVLCTVLVFIRLLVLHN